MLEQPIGDHSRIFQGDALALAAALPPESVHLTFTSPPYHGYKTYGRSPHPADLGRHQDYADYLEQMTRLWKLLYAATVPGGKLVIQAANMKTAETQPATLVPLQWDLTYTAMGAGFLLYDEILWVKMKSHSGSQGGRPLFASYPYPGNPKMLNAVFENLAVLTRPGTRPPVDPERKAQSRLDIEYWKTATNGLWDIPSHADPEHPATFRPELADRVIRLYSFVGETVLDPFAGTGTAVLAAEELGRHGLGFELHPEYVRAAGRRAVARLAQLSLELGPLAAPRPGAAGGDNDKGVKDRLYRPQQPLPLEPIPAAAKVFN